MSYNKYNTRNSVGRYNTTSQFSNAGEAHSQTASAAGARRAAATTFNQQLGAQPPLPAGPGPQQYAAQAQAPLPQRKQQPQNPNPNPNLTTLQSQDVEMANDTGPSNTTSGAGSDGQRPFWNKSKLQGVKKISNKERRRRQNETLRRLLTPKNALMVLNEMLTGEQVNNNFKVEPASQFNTNQYYSKQHSFCADLTIAGQNYKGYGENKMVARNAAAEQAIRDLIIKKMNKLLSTDTGSSGENMEEDADTEEALPMIQLASFALHKLFSEWEVGGHRVPQLRAPPATAASALSASNPELSTLAPRAPKKKELPLNAAQMHPCMLLTYMRPALEYRELGAEGDRPQNMLFTLGVEVDGATYVGKASNKKEARKLAAKSACQALFGIVFDENPTATAPVVAKEE